jgi:tRNA A37 methylthiotransferase MiaB
MRFIFHLFQSGEYTSREQLTSASGEIVLSTLGVTVETEKQLANQIVRWLVHRKRRTAVVADGCVNSDSF